MEFWRVPYDIRDAVQRQRMTRGKACPRPLGTASHFRALGDRTRGRRAILEILPEREERSRVPAAFLVGLVIVALVAGGICAAVASHAAKANHASAVQVLPFRAPDEQVYAAQIHFQNIHLAQSSKSAINQQFTYVAASMSNDGPRTIRALQVSVEFHDQFKQVVLKDSDRIIDRTDDPLPGAKQRDFQVTLEQSVPSEWNQQYPSIRVTGLVLE